MVGRFHQFVEYTMMFVIERNEPEGLRNHVRTATYRLQYFSHALHVAGLSFKSDLDEVAFCKRFWHVQQTAGHRDRLQLGLGSLTVAQCQLGASG